MPTKKPAPRKTATRPKSEPKGNAMDGFSAQLEAMLGGLFSFIRGHLGRHRAVLLYLVPVIVLGFLWFTDPDDGASTKVWALRVVSAAVALALAHWARRAMFDYPEADVRTLFDKARQEPTGAGLALVAVSIFLFAVLMLFAGQVRATTCPDEAVKAAVHLPTLHAEQRRFWGNHPQRELLPALISHETGCPCMRKCWNAEQRLKSQREEGAGLGQITRTWRKDGTQRFDALAEMRDRHPALREWSWENVYQRPDLQLRAVVLMARDNFQYFKRFGLPDDAALAFADAGYNGGNGGVQSDRRACGLTAGCDPRRWFGHVERTCTKSRAALYGQRSACDINRHHVHDVLKVRGPKYRGLV